jgi:hypothetical protein
MTARATISVRELVHHLNVGEHELHYLAYNFRLPFICLGPGKWRIHPKDLAAWKFAVGRNDCAIKGKHMSEKDKYFQKGVSNEGNGGGRPAGARNRLSTAFLMAMAKDFEVHGEAAIRVVRTEKPDVYLRCIASIIPKEFAIQDAKIGELGDEEIAGLLATVRELMKNKAQAEADDDDAQSIH